MSLRINGTSYTPPETTLPDNRNQVSINPGDQFFIKVRALGQDGSAVGFVTGNFASATIYIPRSQTPSSLTAPKLTGPKPSTSDTMPILRWDDVGNAATYDVWFRSEQTNSRLFLATGITQDLAAQPLVSPNLILPFEESGRQSLWISTGRGETFGGSMLARYEVNGDGAPFRPVVVNAAGNTSLELPDLPVGSNVSTLRFLNDSSVLVLSSRLYVFAHNNLRMILT